MKQIFALAICFALVISSCSNQEEVILQESDNINTEDLSQDALNASTVSYDSTLMLDTGFWIFSDAAATVGYEYILIKPGTYTLSYGSSNYSTIDLDVDTVVNAVPLTGGAGVKIRLADRKHKKCKPCVSGIGFRCGFIKWNPPHTPPFNPPYPADDLSSTAFSLSIPSGGLPIGSGGRYASAQLSLINFNNQLRIQFTDFVPFGSNGFYFN